MRPINIWLLSIISLCLTTSCVNELDNYKTPNGGIHGTIVDIETKEPVPLPVQGSTGVILKMMEKGTEATKSVDFYAKQDGTFDNDRVFDCDYLIKVEGPFTAPAEVKATISGQTEVNIPVMPYARIEASASVSGKTVSLQYQVKKTKDSYKVSEVYGYWNFAPGVDDGGANRAGRVTVNDLSGTISIDLGKEQAFLDNLYKIQSNENKIYVRIGAKTEGVINYSQVLVVTL